MPNDDLCLPLTGCTSEERDVKAHPVLLQGTPKGNETIRLFVSYAKRLIRTRLQPLSEIDHDFDKYVENANKPSKFLLDCATKAVRASQYSGELFTIKSFLKRESYPSPKHPRGINPHPIETNTLLGRLFQQLDPALFSLSNNHGPCFVKKIPVDQRAQFISDKFGDRPVNTTDFSSFECHHRGPFTEVAWFWIHHLAHRSVDKSILDVVHELLFKDNLCDFGDIQALVPQTLMSGALWTSSQNGSLNLFIMSFIVLHSKYPNANATELARRFDEFNGCFEGDDGIFEGYVNPDVINRLGLKLKINESTGGRPHENFTTASFCGIVKILDEPTNIVDPRKTMCDFFVLPPAYASMRDSRVLALLRAKALSYYYQYRNVPIVGPLAFAVLERTKSITVSVDDEEDFYKRNILRSAIQSGQFWKQPPEISPAVRVFVEQQFELDVQYQLEYEREISKWGKGEQHCIPSHHSLSEYENNFEQQVSWYDPRPPFLPTRRIEGKEFRKIWSKQTKKKTIEKLAEFREASRRQFYFGYDDSIFNRLTQEQEKNETKSKTE